jgi:hypothetical protein
MHPELLRGSSDSLDLGSFAASCGCARVAQLSPQENEGAHKVFGKMPERGR